MDEEYENTQKEIDRLLWETSQQKTHKKYQDMREDEKYNFKMKRIGKLLLKLKNLEEKNRKTVET